LITSITSPPAKTRDKHKEAENQLVVSYTTLRNLIGFAGMLLPFILIWLSGRGTDDKLIENSISDYYYSSNGDVLVVVLSVLGVFLFTYQGYDWKESALTTLAAICGVGVAFSPTATEKANSWSIHVANESVPMVLGIERHFVFAALFFLALAVMSLHYFPQSDNDPQKSTHSKQQKARRNRVYRICGWVIIACVVLLLLYFIFKPFHTIFGVPIVFFFETIAVEAFGLSWLTKGQTFWPDGEHYLKRTVKEMKTQLRTTKT
jgi:Na+-transporting methylmalonyl-CoA/oxaloacetate decarboxylase gamma subunit